MDSNLELPLLYIFASENLIKLTQISVHYWWEFNAHREIHFFKYNSSFVNYKFVEDGNYVLYTFVIFV